MPEGVPYDRPVVTAQATAWAPAWLEQPADDGRPGVSMRLRGRGRSLARWRRERCGFVAV
ncbi:hypothetical protein [Streptomyces sp. NPDC049879]|uniref:hypothetical protein n=1 Tax=Streptomyces sp. NPDC049879 TaxID=3365598 RepID=UPI0037B1374B